MVRHIRRYANRKNYDMNDSCYTNHDQIAEKVRAGDEVCVTEHLSGRDITVQILAQIIHAELEDGRSSVTVATLTKVIREGIPADLPNKT
jgi:polyhydroxyalkanoate synthesis regulator protein